MENENKSVVYIYSSWAVLNLRENYTFPTWALTKKHFAYQ